MWVGYSFQLCLNVINIFESHFISLRWQIFCLIHLPFFTLWKMWKISKSIFNFSVPNYSVINPLGFLKEFQIKSSKWLKLSLYYILWNRIQYFLHLHKVSLKFYQIPTKWIFWKIEAESYTGFRYTFRAIVHNLLLDIRVVFSQQEIKLGGQPRNSPLHIDNHVNKKF